MLAVIALAAALLAGPAPTPSMPPAHPSPPSGRPTLPKAPPHPQARPSLPPRPGVPHPGAHPSLPAQPRMPARPVAPVAPDQRPIAVLVNGKAVKFDVAPVLDGSFVFVPLRGVFEKMKAQVSYNPVTHLVTARRGQTTVEVRVGDKLAHVNGETVFMLVPATSVGSRTLVPLRFVSEALGAEVEWSRTSRTVSIVAR